MKKLIVVVILFSLSITTFSYAQTKRSQKEIFQVTYKNSKALVASQHFQFVGELVYNADKREKLESNSNGIRLNKTKVSGTLKALGKADKILEINGIVKNYNASYDDDKQSISVHFLVNGNKVHIAILPSGKALITSNLANANAMTWLGKLIKL
jgi:hypothetical protein